MDRHGHVTLARLGTYPGGNCPLALERVGVGVWSPVNGEELTVKGDSPSGSPRLGFGVGSFPGGGWVFLPCLPGVLSWAGCQSQTLAMGREIPVRQEAGQRKKFFFSHGWVACLGCLIAEDPDVKGMDGLSWRLTTRAADGGTPCGCHLCASSEWLAGW